jgi:DNA mismatch repair ATPase MutS
MGGLLVQLTDRLEHWRDQHGEDVARWLSTTAEFEALISIAAWRFDHPQYCTPVISETAAVFESEQLGHPLLKSDQCVRNDVLLTADLPLMLISGSNMSGKSTLLRSVGTNLVLTFCGAVVNADRLTTYPFQLATAMRISDSLQEGRSLFYSVVQRLKSVVDLTRQPRTVLFLLDEILHGTNSHDRRRGAEGVIRSLIAQHAMGIVTTHDLALTQIVDSMEGRGVNKHFEDTVVDGKMSFDYQLRDGVVTRSNAIELMRMMGLDV